MDWIFAIITGVISGVIASGVFVYVLSLYRPNIKISHLISKRTENDVAYFTFKIANLSKRPCINLHVDAAIARMTNIDGGQLLVTQELDLAQKHLFELPGYKKKDTEGFYAWRFVSNSDLDELWKTDDDIIRFRVLATDSFTGISRAFIQTYRLRRKTLKEGAHQFGLDMDVV